jgi:hypothetical protein
MNSTSNLDASNSDADLIARADERLAHAYEQIARADEQLAHVTEQLSRLEQEAARQPPAAVLAQRASHGRPVLRGLVAALLAACVFAAAFVSQSSYGEAARQIVAEWAPQLVSTTSLWREKPEAAAQPSRSTAQIAAAEPAPAQAIASAQGAPQNTASAAAAISSELTQLLQTMARDLANMEQGIEQLKANQERIASDTARAVGELKTSQEQLTRLVAKASEQDQRARTQAASPQPVVNATRKPLPTPSTPRNP